MDVQAQAGIGIYGRVMRYAEVEHYGNQHRLLRLGSCDFDFDVVEGLFFSDESAYLETVAEALNDVFKGAVAADLRVALHPPACVSFPSPVLAGADEAPQARLAQEAALLVGEAAEPLRLTTEHLYDEALSDGREVAWHHVLALPASAYDRFDRLLRALPHTGYRFMLSTQSVARVAAQLERAASVTRGAEGPYSLAVGTYPTHTEYALLRGATWHFSHYAEATEPTDAVYFGADLLRRLGLAPRNVSTLYTYGPGADARAPLEQAFRRAPLPLDPLPVVEVDSEGLDDQFDPSAYATCIGAAL